MPEVQEQPASRRGDVWICGSHKVLCGDATQADDYAALLGDELVDMTFTDPPYNVGYANNPKDKLRGKHRPILNDNLGSDFGAFLEACCTQMVALTKGAIYIAVSSSELDRLQSAFRAAGGRWSTFIIWAKNKFATGHADYQRQYEPILYGWRDGNDRFWCGARDQGDVWFIDRTSKNGLHPTMKPVALVGWREIIVVRLPHDPLLLSGDAWLVPAIGGRWTVSARVGQRSNHNSKKICQQLGCAHC
ncbi:MULTISPECIES: hypothetical protein [unclassified Lysobacter]|uniref:DNA-methyltransferase n=1 Tax=unclassified Lysobacter TaxID=2635362 RepID=UPI001BEC5F92|nr:MULTISPECIES: hypothetical protein [unclassified Lysobacter]MBT2748652.1 site-specific DNA-methyltransferase [Lysobacter sp. ISL-42]MBT2751587.1 site-specific DNA-methyltransferase [Lysobacter sp. ISL-50]MBT2775781.1 site-specific DNA-methyltransferase [Lysobacter sp. ISL-54]MBT2782254.1 site-specific DNA-methyltransferase [Lysobacter sp. ISL-52]